MARSTRRSGSTSGSTTGYGINGLANGWRWDEETRGGGQGQQGSYVYPQASACFIQSVVGRHAGHHEAGHFAEAMLFKFGSGTGTDLSTLRSSKEKLAGGGRPSGPVSFMRVYDSIAGVVKSGRQDAPRREDADPSKSGTPMSSNSSRCKTKEEKKALGP